MTATLLQLQVIKQYQKIVKKKKRKHLKWNIFFNFDPTTYPS